MVSRAQSIEGKTANKFIAGIECISFNPIAFGYILVNAAPRVLHDRIMAAAKSIITSMADQYDAGVCNDATMDAKRLQDTMNLYGMDG
jgi:hypothetical protein